jgi:hypothetical protein
VQNRNVVQFVARLFMAYNQCPFFSLSLSLSLSKEVVDDPEGKVDDVQPIFRQLSFLKERKGSI